MKTELQLNSFRAEGSNCSHSDARQCPLPQACRGTDTHLAFRKNNWSDTRQCPLPQACRETDTHFAFRNNNWLVRPLLLLTTRVLA